MDKKKTAPNDEPTVAPSMYGHDPLEEKASEQEIEKGDYTSVTKLFVDRTPED